MHESIAIVGMACRFPGARNLSKFWENLLNGVESITFFSDSELLEAGVEPATLAQSDYVKASPVLEDIYGFDAEFFGFAPTEAEIMDPQQRIMLQTAWEALEDAGYPPSASHLVTGVFMGSGGVLSSYLAAHLHQYPEFVGSTGSMSHIGNDKDFLSTRISFKLNLTGPSLNVQTACSTSLVAVHLACKSLQQMECDMALAGVSAIRFPHIRGYVSRRGDILSPDGHCRAFDADAQGTIFGSGVGVVVLRRLSDAIAAGDQIYAVIRSTAVNNDGAEKVSYTASSVKSQAAAMVEAITLAGVDANSIGYVECHGTGTAVGDPLEIMALTQAFRVANWQGSQRCKIGSVKTNIGHLEQAAGMASLIKTALMLKHGRIPPLLNFNRPNPSIDFETSPFEVAREVTAFESSGPRRAMINCLGIGGTNACCILEQAAPPAERQTPRLPGPRFVLCLSGRTAAVVEEQARRLAGSLNGGNAADVCATANAGRVHFQFRQAVTGSSLDEIRSSLETVAAVETAAKPSIIFLFPGQGSHYFRAGKELYDTYGPFRSLFDECSERLSAMLGLQIRDVLFEEQHQDLLFDTFYAQPLLFAIGYAIAKLWESWNVRADAVIGHSVGEITAVCYAGGMSLEDGIKLICKRAELMAGIERRGSMAAVFAPADKVIPFYQDGAEDVSVAAINAPDNTVISGATEAVAAVLSRLAAAGIPHKELRVSHAFHSRLLDPILDSLETFCGGIHYRKPRIPVVSNLTGSFIESFSGRYWREHARMPVRFMDGVTALASRGASLFLEVGPGSTLTGLGRQCVRDSRHSWVATLERDKPEWTTLAEALRTLYLRACPLDWSRVYAPFSPRKISLPTYPFETRPYALKPRNVTSVQIDQSESTRNLLRGERIRTALKDAIYEARYSLPRIPFLSDHRIYGIPALPTAAALDAALCAGWDHLDKAELSLADVTYWDPLVMPETGDLQVQTILSPAEEGVWTFELLSSSDAQTGWRRHVSGRAVTPAPENSPQRSVSVSVLKARCPHQIPVDRFYAFISNIGLNYGDAFRCIRSIHLGHQECLTRVELGPELQNARHSIHPALLDACLHIYPALADEFDPELAVKPDTQTFLPTGVASFQVLKPEPQAVWVHAARVTGGERNSETMVVDLRLFHGNGEVVADLLGLSLRRMSPEMLHPSATKPTKDWVYELVWRESGSQQAAVTAPGNAEAQWVVFCDEQGVGDELCRRLSLEDASCHTVRRKPSKAPAALFLDPDRVDDWPAQLGALFRELGGGQLEVVYLWALDSPNLRESSDPSAPEMSLYRQTLEILRGISKARSGAIAKPRLWVITRGSQVAGAEQIAPNVEQAPLWGMARTFSWEAPLCWGGLIDLDPSDSVQTLGERLLHELTRSDPSDQRVVRADRRVSARLVRSVHDAAGDERSGSLFRKDGVYLITGGLGALGARVAKWMAQRGAGHVVLTGRQGRDGREPVVAEIEREGISVTIVKADAADPAGMRQVFAQIDSLSAPLRGILHCAGILDDGVIEQMTWAKFNRVVDAKIAGGWLLHQFSLRYELDYFILFSSILSLTGSAGQVNYTAGNAFLDSLAEYRRQRQLPCQVINWGPWDEGGLATASGHVGRSIWKARGIGYIPPAEGMQVLEYLVRLKKPSAAIMVADWTRFLKQFSSTPDFYAELSPAAAIERHREQALDLRRLSEVSPYDKREILRRAVSAEVVGVLGIEGHLDVHRPIADLGMDSLMSVNLLNRLDRLLDRPTPFAKLTQGPSVAELVDFLYPELQNAAANPIVDLPGIENGRVSQNGSRLLVPMRPLSSIKSRIKGLRNRFQTRYAALFLRFGVQDLAAALERVGVRGGDTLFVHSSFDRFAGFQGTALDVITLLQQMVGTGGTVLMPQQPFSGSAIDWAESGELFDVRDTPTQMGLLPELFRRMAGVTRSLHPTHSVAAWGARATELLAGHEQAESPCGFGSPYMRLHESGGKILHLGSPFTTSTFLHAADELLRDRMPFSPLTEQVYTIKFRDWDGRERETRQRLFDRRYARIRRPQRLVPALRKRGIYHETTVSLVSIILVEVRPLVEAMGELADAGFYFYDVAALNGSVANLLFREFWESVNH